MFSKPHFLDVDTTIRKQVDGVYPDQKKHGGFIDIHAVTLTYSYTKYFVHETKCQAF